MNNLASLELYIADPEIGNSSADVELETLRELGY